MGTSQLFCSLLLLWVWRLRQVNLGVEAIFRSGIWWSPIRAFIYILMVTTKSVSCSTWILQNLVKLISWASLCQEHLSAGATREQGGGQILSFCGWHQCLSSACCLNNPRNHQEAQNLVQWWQVHVIVNIQCLDVLAWHLGPYPVASAIIWGLYVGRRIPGEEKSAANLQRWLESWDFGSEG